MSCELSSYTLWHTVTMFEYKCHTSMHSALNIVSHNNLLFLYTEFSLSKLIQLDSGCAVPSF